MKILFVHNSYQSKGGEDSVLQAEQNLLSCNGQQYDLFQISNHDISNGFTRIKTVKNISYSHQARNKLALKLSEKNFDIVHVHNFFPLLTPSIYDACIEAEVPVVQTLHNYRTICPGALLMRNGKICEKCLTGSPYQAILHRCYRNSTLGSWAVARMVADHRNNQTWRQKVDRFIALTHFGKQKFVEAGFPTEKIIVKPNFCEAPSVQNYQKRSRSKGKGALFVGRLSKEKGVATLLQGWQKLDIPLRIVGDGPLLNSNKDSCSPY